MPGPVRQHLQRRLDLHDAGALDRRSGALPLPSSGRQPGLAPHRPLPELGRDDEVLAQQPLVVAVRTPTSRSSASHRGRVGGIPVATAC